MVDARTGRGCATFFRCASPTVGDGGDGGGGGDGDADADADADADGIKGNRGAVPLAVGGAAFSRRAGPYAFVGDAPRGERALGRFS